jgi:hypothetical protein
MNKQLKQQFAALVKHVVLEQIDEGGLGGHMAHVHEDQDLTFGEIKAIMHQASKGKLEAVTEKLDGQNTFFSYDPQNGLRFARNTENIVTGGMGADEIESRWADKPTVAKAFGKAYKILAAAVAVLSPGARKKIFNDGKIWYSAEIVGTLNPNVINYDQDAIIFHESGTVYDEKGQPLNIDNSANFAALIANVNRMQNAVKETGWQVLGPVMVNLQKLANNEPLEIGLSSLNEFMNRWTMDNENNLNDAFHEHLVQDYLKDLTADDDTKLYIAELISDFDNTLTSKKPALNDLVEQGLLVKEQYKMITELIKNGPKLYTKFIEPVRDIIREFAIAMLRGVQSYLILNPNQEIQRLRSKVETAIQQIKNTRTEREIDIMNKELSRLRGLDNITSSMEGIAFKYNGKLYKLTGAFAPVNQILGIEKYGR